MRLTYGDLAYAFRDYPVVRVVLPDELDDRLVQRGVEQGVVVRKGEAVREVCIDEDRVRVVTGKDTLHARVVVAADGSRSVLRQALGWDRRAGGGRLLEVETAEVAETQSAFR